MNVANRFTVMKRPVANGIANGLVLQNFNPLAVKVQVFDPTIIYIRPDIRRIKFIYIRTG